MLLPMTVALERFKASCLDLISLVNRTGEEVLIAEHGEALARLVPARSTPPANLFGKLVESTHVTGDIVRRTRVGAGRE
jgi:antitoxin (DNA-binding transcriptional repressor) of toxin-antitoxin stability system